MARIRRASSAAWTLAIVFGFCSPSVAGNSAIRACVESGGTYLEDGTCEMGAGDAARQCRRQGGQYRGGYCDLPQEDPVDRCKDAGGVILHEGKCYKPVTR